MIEFAMQKAWLIPLLPFIAFLIIGLLTKSSQKLSAFVALLAMGTSFALALAIGFGVLSNPELITQPLEYNARWFSMEGLTVEMGVRIDPISAMMLFVVTLVAFLVQIYSVGYMHGDPGFSRFFAYLSLFASSMLGLVISTNLLQMFVFWELVGLCSYLLIGYYYFKVSAREAAKKAFMTTRIGDFGLLLGILFLQIVFGTLNFTELAERVPNFVDYGITAGLLNVIAVLIFIGPIGKSGQFPLHVWLPDAMEGPTPVSALIHAATMVVAGVYLIGRTLFLFEVATTAAEVVAYIGGFTAIFAAYIALTQVELKKILAYSTVSQLGYMMLALGVGSLTASFFHLFTHAFFKALMFLAAGSVLHAFHDRVGVTIWDFGGLRKLMPYTAAAFIIGGLAIAGIWPFAGFYSKDEILLAAWDSGHQGLFWLALVTAAMTAFYMWRMIFLTFFGPEKPENHPHESPASMLFPLFVLGILSIAGGWVFLPEHGWAYWITTTPGVEGHHAPGWMVALATASGVGGIALAYLMYVKNAISYKKIAEAFSPLYKLSYNKFYVDELYLWFNHTIVDGLGRILYWVDLYIIDGIVNGLGFMTKEVGSALRYTQTGRLQTYAMIIFIAVVLIVIFMTMNPAVKDMLVLGGGN